MLQIGTIKIRDIKELQAENVILAENSLTPLRKRKNSKSFTTSKKRTKQILHNDDVNSTTIKPAKTSRKSLLKSTLKETPSNQKRIDSYFTSCPKNYEIKFPKEDVLKSKAQINTKSVRATRNASTKTRKQKDSSRTKTRRRRLFTDSAEPSSENISVLSFVKENKDQQIVECITIDSDSEGDCNFINKINASIEKDAESIVITPLLKTPSVPSLSSISLGQRMPTTTGNPQSVSNCNSSSRRKIKQCPPYKVIENTTFAVDAFQFGYIENVTHYFLSHFHADHYIGLTKKFAMPLYMSFITARLLRTFIPVQEEYINELELNQPYIINNIEVTALDANHCPGSILLVFKFPDTGKCILHTGDFRASHEMESEPIFWNNDIDTIYLDTTYISDKYAFCSQYESLMKAQDLIDKFLEKHAGKRVLFICGAYIIGKEKFWSSLAENYEMKVWAEGNRHKALKAINEERINRLLVEDPKEANMHIIPMGKVSYLELVEYFKLYEEQYDLIFAIRPSGWEKDSKPRYGSKINLVGVEYSEHSSYEEMQRFVKFLKPKKVISTVPTGKDLMKTSQVPTNWYKYDQLKGSSNYQPSIDTFFGKAANNNLSVRLLNLNKDGVDEFVSPLKDSILFAKETNYNQNISKTSFTPKKLNGDLRNLTEKVPTNFQICDNPTEIEINAKAISLSNSSEDFEKPDITIKTNKHLRNINENKDKIKNNSLTKGKPHSIQNHTPECKTKSKINSKEYLETPNVKLRKRKKTQKDKKDANGEVSNVSLKHSPENEFHANVEISIEGKPTSQHRRSKSNNFTIKPTRESLRLQNRARKISGDKLLNRSVQSDKAINSKSKLNSVFQRNPIHKSTSNFTADSRASDELRKLGNKTGNHDLEISHKIKSVCSNAIFNFADENEIDSELPKFKVKPKLNCTTNSSTCQENHELKSTTESTTKSKEIPKHRRTEEVNLNSPISSENGVNAFECTTQLSNSKSQGLDQSLKSLKKGKPSVDTKTLLNSILEKKERIERYNCSQVAGLVVEAIHKENPDNIRDYTALNLLSDADDDWM